MMSNWIVIPLLLLVMLGCAIAAGYFTARARETGEAEKLRLAIEDTQREIGKALLPPLERAMTQMNEWLSKRR